MNILLIKLGALGDVLRTTPLVTGIRKKFPTAHITWLVDERHRDVLEGNPEISEIQSLELGQAGSWRRQAYDWVINLDKEPEALEAFESAQGLKKSGFGRALDGTPRAADTLSDYALRLGLDDELKFRINRKSYQEISFEQLGLSFQREDYVLAPDEKARAQAAKILADKGMTRRSKIIGLNTGAGQRFAGKKLPAERYRELAEMLVEKFGAQILLLGGADEIERNQLIQRTSRVPLINTGSHPLNIFAGFVENCDLVITGDTTAMHIAIAVRTPVLAYFASTCEAEIELYGRGQKIVSTIECAPCYKKICPINEKCMADLPLGQFIEKTERILGAQAVRVS